MSTNNWREVGPIVKLQLQRQPLKIYIDDKTRVYKPENLMSVSSLVLTPEGIIAYDGDEMLYDAHHTKHPQSRNKGNNGISFGITGNYAHMQDRLGEHIMLGVGGENIIIAADDRLSDEDFMGQIAFRTADGEMIILDNVFAMAPCETFSRYCLAKDTATREEIKATLQFLQGGMRGFCGELVEPGAYTIRVGDTLLVRP